MSSVEVFFNRDGTVTAVTRRVTVPDLVGPPDPTAAAAAAPVDERTELLALKLVAEHNNMVVRHASCSG